MAERADGTVYINSSIDTTGLKPGGKEIEAACKRMAKSVADMGNKVKAHTQEIAGTLVQQNKLYAEQADKVEKLKQQMEELREQKVTTTEFQKLEKQIVKDSEDLEKMISLQKEFVEMGGSKDDSYYTNLQARIEQLGNKIEEVKKKKEDLMQSGEAYTGETVNTADTEEYRNAVKEYEAELANLNKLGMGVQASFARLAQKVQQFGGTVSGVYRLKGAMEELKNIGNMVIHPIQTVKDAFSTLVYRMKDSAAGLGASVINGLLQPFQALKSVAKAAAKSISSKLVTSLQKAASAAMGVKKHTNGVGHGFKQMLKYSLGIRSLYTLFNRVRSAIKDGFKNLAQHSTETNKSMSTLKSSMTQLKNSLATAFAPILTVIEPILTRFINLLSQVITYVGMFFAALTGASSFTKAVAVQEDYAAGLGETAENAKEAKKYLSCLDEIRTYTSDSDYSGGGYSGVSPADMFETVPIESKIKELADKIKRTLSEMFAPLKESWEKYGAPITEKLGQIKDRFVEFGGQIASSTVEWFKNLNWDPLLQSVDKLIGSLQPLIDVILDGLAWAWENVLEPFGKWAIEEGIPAVLNAISGALELINAMAEKAAPRLQAIWDNFLAPVAEFVGDAFVAFFETLGRVLSDIANNKTAVSILTGIAAAIGLIVAAMTAWNVVMAITHGLMELFAANPIVLAITAIIAAIILCITYWDEIKAAMQSVWDKIVEVFGGLGDWFSEKWDAVKVATLDTWNEIKSTVSDIWDGIVTTIKDGVNSVIGFINGMISGVVAGINLLINALNAISFTIPDWSPLFPGKSFGLNIPAITAPQIPYLASGAVIPPNAPFMAMLGDQKHGTNIEAPLSLIEDAVNKAVRNAMGNQQRGGTYIFEAQLDRRTIFRQVIEEAKLRQTVTGRNPFELT